MQDATTIDQNELITDWQRRLVALANDPPWVYHGTPHHRIKAHYRRMTTFEGYTEEEVAKSEQSLGVEYPEMFRAFLLRMGKVHGDLWRGTDTAKIEEFEKLHDQAHELLAETDETLRLPSNAIVCFFHQGYQFDYMVANGGLDTPVMNWTEDETQPHQVAATFAERIESSVKSMEKLDRSYHESGGHWIELFDVGQCATYSASATGILPLRTIRGRIQRWWLRLTVWRVKPVASV